VREALTVTLDARAFRALKVETSFNIVLGYLKACKAEHGDCRVPKRFKTEDGFGLGGWCSEKRTSYKKGRLSQERIDALEALGFVWDVR